MVNQITTAAKERLKGRLGTVFSGEMQEVGKGQVVTPVEICRRLGITPCCWRFKRAI